VTICPAGATAWQFGYNVRFLTVEDFYNQESVLTVHANEGKIMYSFDPGRHVGGVPVEGPKSCRCRPDLCASSNGD
jgi:hypothetical protein